MQCFPRPPPVSLEGRDAIKTPWDFNKSVFKDFKPDSAKLLDDCFEFDWALTKCEKVIKDPEVCARAKSYLKSIYKKIRETYKYISGLQPLGRCMSIGAGTLTEMLHHCTDFIDGRVIKLSDIDLALIACNGGRKVTTMWTPDKALVRAQFMDVLVRLSFDKYFKTG